MGNLFVYGTLKDERIQKKIIGRVVERISDIVFGYKIKTITVEGKKYPLLVKDKGLVKGLILKLTSEELRKIDEYETDVYRRVKETLKSGVKAWVYVKDDN